MLPLLEPRRTAIGVRCETDSLAVASRRERNVRLPHGKDCLLLGLLGVRGTYAHRTAHTRIGRL